MLYSRDPEHGLTSTVRPTNKQHICLSCRSNISRVRHASTATAQATVEAPPISQIAPDEPGASPVTQPRIVVKAGVVVSRPPLLTPDPHPFDTAFHLYQRRLNERLVLPFSQYFHYKRGTPAFENWRTKRRERGGVAARDLGDYSAYTKESWNDEVLIGDSTADPQKIVAQLVEEEGRQSEFTGEDGDTKLAGLKRATEADQKQDQKSLERSLSRTLYLLVRNKSTSKGEDAASSWRFPSGDVEGKEGLKEVCLLITTVCAHSNLFQAAQRVLGESCGENMNTWFVASHPIGHFVEAPTSEKDTKSAESNENSQSTDIEAEKTFFMKARIFAGQADLEKNSYGVEEFKWLSKEEVEKHVTPEYWSSVKNMLVEQ